MSALPFMVGALCVLAIAYRYYSAFLAYRVVGLDPARRTAAHVLKDGANYHPTNRWVLFGHHFAAIAGAGPLIGPVLAAQFGFFPGYLWLLVGVVLAGAVQDFMILFASTRRHGKSLAEIARQEIGPVAGLTTAIAILFIVIVALAGLGLAVVNALRESPWGVFTIGCSIPLALFMGLYLYRFRKGRIAEASAIGVIGLLAAVFFGQVVAQSSWAPYLTLSTRGVTLAMAAYGFIASVLPVWLLLCPRDYLSSYMKVGTIALLIVGVLWVNPPIHQPMVSRFAAGGGPIIPGTLFPFLFTTIACGAISGFHALVGSGTTPKMIENERDIRPIGYGAMLLEGLVGITALIACCALQPSDYFAINVAPEQFAALGMTPVHLDALAQQVGEPVAGRTGGAVTLAVGMAQVFSGLPGMRSLMSYWYHFAIMFEALFILTTIDTGTRVARFILQEFLGTLYRPFERTDWLPGTLLSSALVVGAWSYFILTGSIATIWPMFGIANQLLAVIALCVATTVLINMGRARYAWVTVLPMLFVATTTLTAGWQSVWQTFLPLAAQPGQGIVGSLNAGLTLFMMACTVLMIGNSALRWRRALAVT
ncbi:MAG: carbon starvation protein CstA [Omnitrophica WOR_2 bacterium RIFCSPHIGHO2_02_FULL_68_15]|nr:MAG: carbon starvation protein CstA [Omnitrophica WOR_2 bacterium RIFCSPHIGHO2_02_FULL_68_15]